jgi:hypothetical protein
MKKRTKPRRVAVPIVAAYAVCHPLTGEIIHTVKGRSWSPIIHTTKRDADARAKRIKWPNHPAMRATVRRIGWLEVKS